MAKIIYEFTLKEAIKELEELLVFVKHPDDEVEVRIIES